ncbi:MAG: hypothetical protein JRH20_03215 [Deltaproteobacteria bacterium]|nr:hypothetical protein [Deltaproteobacteria bacterium]
MVWKSAVVILGIFSTGDALAKERRVCVEVVLREPTARPVEKTMALPPTTTSPTSSKQIRPSQPTAPKVGGPQVDDHESPKTPAVDLLGQQKKARLRPRRLRRPPRASLVRPPRWKATRYDLSQMPLGQTPVTYLERLLEHFVTHEGGFTAAKQKCEQTLRVELYPLREGWTAFARYTGHGREEWVEQLLPDELSQFAERAVQALLHNQPISTTIKRDTVLRADTRIPKRWIGGTHHLAISLGTQLRFGIIDTVQDGGAVESEVRIFSPMTFNVGYRGKFENWAIEAMGNLGLNANRTAVRRNPAGGHVDMGGNAGISVHFLRYLNPRGITSFYLGAGSRFEVLWFELIRAESAREGDTRSTLASGGINVDLVFGWEFMRATKIQWVIQGEVHLPAYIIDTENDHGRVGSWVPGASLSLGVLF